MRDTGEMERRAKVRYPVEVTVRYRALDRKDCGYVTGQTINLSSRGVLVATRDAGHVHERSKVELKIHWACPLGGTIPLNLVAIGTVVRCGQSTFAVTLERHEFRIVGKAAPMFSRAIPLETEVSCKNDNGTFRQHSADTNLRRGPHSGRGVRAVHAR